MMQKPDGCVKQMPQPKGKVPKKQGSGSMQNPKYETPTAKMPKRMG